MRRKQEASFNDLYNLPEFENGTKILQGAYGKKLVTKNKDFKTILKQINTYSNKNDITPSQLIHTYFNYKYNQAEINLKADFSGNQARIMLRIGTIFDYENSKMPKTLLEFNNYVANSKELQEIEQEAMPRLAKFVLENNLLIDTNKLSNQINDWRLYYKKKQDAIAKAEKIGVTAQANVQFGNVSNYSFEDYVFKKDNNGFIFPYFEYSRHTIDFLFRYNPRFADCVYKLESKVHKNKNGKYGMFEYNVVVGIEQKQNKLKRAILGTSNLNDFVNKGWKSIEEKRTLLVLKDFYYDENSNLKLSDLFKYEDEASASAIISKNIKVEIKESARLAQEIGRKFVDKNIHWQQIPVKVWLLTLILAKKYKYGIFTLLKEENKEFAIYTKQILAKLNKNSSKNITDLENKEEVASKNAPKLAPRK